MQLSRISWLFVLAFSLPTALYAYVLETDKHVKHKHWTKDYDVYFKKYAKHYFGPHVDWHWFKAQGIAESNLNPKAKSPVGAKGIMQIMPATYKEILNKNPHIPATDEPRWNIAAGIFYDRMLYRKWKRKKTISTKERLSFSFASYNAGLGTVLKAFKKASKKHGDVKQWQQVEGFAPGETRFYVKRIHNLMNKER
ncbi:MAG: transglycosylase SLT domain-containing protein [Gammaproteobacteria bacterium]|nr:transglycosylase SLT domain-containing protein [Gammaproteobacteria bacterium]